jgi:hypothetical protein
MIRKLSIHIGLRGGGFRGEQLNHCVTTLKYTNYKLRTHSKDKSKYLFGVTETKDLGFRICCR